MITRAVVTREDCVPFMFYASLTPQDATVQACRDQAFDPET